MKITNPIPPIEIDETVPESALDILFIIAQHIRNSFENSQNWAITQLKMNGGYYLDKAHLTVRFYHKTKPPLGSRIVNIINIILIGSSIAIVNQRTSTPILNISLGDPQFLDLIIMTIDNFKFYQSSTNHP